MIAKVERLRNGNRSYYVRDGLVIDVANRDFNVAQSTGKSSNASAVDEGRQREEILASKVA